MGAEVNVKFTDRATVSDMTAQQLACYHLVSTYDTRVTKATCMFSFGFDLSFDYLQMYSLREVFVLFHQEALSESQPEAQGTQFHQVLS